MTGKMIRFPVGDGPTVEGKGNQNDTMLAKNKNRPTRRRIPSSNLISNLGESEREARSVIFDVELGSGRLGELYFESPPFYIDSFLDCKSQKVNIRSIRRHLKRHDLEENLE